VTQEQLQALCQEWQAILRLQDWDVRCKIVRKRELEGERAGECRWQLDTKQALIRILDPIDWPTDCEWPQDIEQTLVHELLHLHMAPFQPEHGTLEHVTMEQAIKSIATGLVRLRRACGTRIGEGVTISNAVPQ